MSFGFLSTAVAWCRFDILIVRYGEGRKAEPHWPLDNVNALLASMVIFSSPKYRRRYCTIARNSSVVVSKLELSFRE